MRKWREYADDLEAKDETSKAFEERFFRLTDTLDGAKLDGFLDPEAAALSVPRSMRSTGPIPRMVS